MRKSDKFTINSVAGTTVLVPFGSQTINFNGIITLNPTAQFLWENIEGEFDAEKLTDMLCGAYEVDRETAMKSALKFIDALKDVGALEVE